MKIKNCVQISSIKVLKATSAALSDIGKRQSDTDGLVRSDTASIMHFTYQHSSARITCKDILAVRNLYMY